jgi:hypothetical protein
MVFEPVGGHLFVKHGIAGIGGVLDDKEEPQAEAYGKRDTRMRENSPHEQNASYNIVDGFEQSESAPADAQVLAKCLERLHEGTRANFL